MSQTEAITDPRQATGIRKGVGRPEYESVEAINFSVVKYCRQSPAHARHRQLHRESPTPAQELGTLIHCYLLEPARFARAYVELPDLTRNLKTKAGETPKNPTATAEYKARLAEFEQDHPGRKIVSPAEMATLRGIGESVAACQGAAEAIDPGCGDAEVAALWTDPDTGLACKALLDFLSLDGSAVADVKSVDDASPGPFARLVAQKSWHVQAAFYLWALSVLGRPARRFVHVAVEVTPPFGVAVYELDDAALAQGMKDFRSYLDAWARCVQSGHFPSYPDVVQPLSLPRYALTRDDE